MNRIELLTAAILNTIEISKERGEEEFITDLISPEIAIKLSQNYDWKVVEMDDKNYYRISQETGLSRQQIQNRFTRIKFD